MKAINTSIIINSSPDQIWQTLMNFKDFSNWNPFIVSIEGKAKEGTHLKTQIILGKKKPQTFKPNVLKVKTNEEFRWKGKLWLKGLFDGEHYFILEKIKEGKTKFIHGENFSGIFSKPIMNMIKDDTLEGFEKMNQALKIKVESK